jgi:CHAT domain-containing protein
VTEQSVKGYVLPAKATIEQSARELYSAVTARQIVNGESDDNYQTRVDAADNRYDREALRLSRMLLGPVSRELGNKRLIIVSEGALQYVPFEALPLPDVEPGTLVVSRHEVVTLPSMLVLREIRSKGRMPTSTNTIAVFADPVSGASDERVRYGTNEFTSGDDLIRLAHSSEEAAEIAKMAPSNIGVFSGFAASRENVLTDRLAQYRIVHFATHGVVDTQRPDSSGIVLSMIKPDGTPENGYLRLRDIYRLKMAADLTVLSACDTALGKDVKGEGLIGLTRGFMYAGSKSVVASLWKVDDRATAVLMKHFYRNMLQDHLPPAAALRAAKEIVRQQPGWAEPYFWAGFVIQGEYLESVELHRDQPLQVLFLMTSILMPSLIAALILIKSNRRTGPSDQQHA